uniref:Protein kinase domain-containing protein n=1 Tax=Globisporangium ultimum (strain ATCC 200006 / CBS 805.95 / DAOM BR144) TaxID=431595 RepID=K3WI37_GLOUD
MATSSAPPPLDESAARTLLTDQHWLDPPRAKSYNRKRRVSNATTALIFAESEEDAAVAATSRAVVTAKLFRATISASGTPQSLLLDQALLSRRRLENRTSATSRLSSRVYDSILASPRTGGKFVFTTYDTFPRDRYEVLREWNHAFSNAAAAYQNERHRGQKIGRHQVLQSVVAIDRADGSHVVLTCLAKTIATEWQIHHAVRVMHTLSRQSGFQKLLHIWDAGTNWVFTQEYDSHWECVDAYFTARNSFAEEKLREIIFQVVALVHFLHAHRLSLSGELYFHDLMLKDGKVTLLFNAMFLLSGYTLVPANERNKAADIAAIGMLMFQICMAPFVPQGTSFDIFTIEHAIEDQLSHVSSACRDTLFDCLAAKPTIDELSKRKWIRHVAFISVSSKLEHSHGSAHMRSLLYNSLMWKLAAFFLIDWANDPHNAAAFRSMSTSDDEETRQRLKQQKTHKRILVGRKLLLSGHSPHWLKRGAAILPPLTSSILPHENDDEGGVDDLSRSLAATSLVYHEIIPSSSSSGYNSFTYDFPVPYSGTYGPAYDAFESTEEDMLLGEGATMDLTTMTGPRRRGSSVGHSWDDVHPSQEFQRETVRSLLTESFGSQSPKPRSSGFLPPTNPTALSPQVPFSPEVSTDPLFFSAFGPHNLAYVDSFRIDIWAYLQQQRDSMLETALEQNEAEVGQHVQPFHIQRGTLITVMLEANDYFGVHGDDSKTFRWRGDVSGVSFELYRKRTRHESDGDDELCIARIIAGTKVSLLYIRFHITPQGLDKDVALLESHLEHVSAQVTTIPSQELTVVRPVGHGAFGDAMLAKWHNETEVVVKVLHKDMYRNSDAVAEFQHEAAVMHMLGKHPHVVELLGVCSDFASTTDDASFSLVTEYLPHGSVQDVLRNSSSRFSMTSSFGVFPRTIMARDAAHGLANIHQGHFLHRDIAARNCLVDGHFRVKVCDFGLSRKLNPSGFLFDDDRHGFGPLKWMAPESILPPHLFSMQSDSYMFGVLMYEIFSGQQPFPSLSTREAIALIREGKHVPIPEGLSATHEKLMRQCFSLHPLQRPTMDQIYSTLDAWVLHDTKTSNATVF